MMRILLVEPDLEENGALRVSLDRARRWVEQGADVTVLFVSDHDNGTKVAIPSGLRVLVAGKGMKSARWKLPQALARGWTAARSADVVVAGREIASGLLIGTILARIARRPLAVTVHCNVERALAQHGTPRHRRNVLACLRRADVLAPVSRGLVPGLCDLGIERDRIKVVENGLDLERLQAMAAQPPSVAVPALPYIMAVGRLTHQKGFDLLIRAHSEALRNGAPEHRLLIAGEGPDEHALGGLAAELGVESSVIFAGFLANPFPLLRGASALALSSRWEGFSLALGEALALAVPSIAADCVAGPRELLDGGRYGDLLPVEDAGALPSAIARHLHAPERLREMARQGQSFVTERYCASVAARKHLELLAEWRPVPSCSPDQALARGATLSSQRPSGPAPQASA